MGRAAGATRSRSQPQEQEIGADSLPSRSFSEGWSGALQGNGAGSLSVPSVASCKSIGSWRRQRRTTLQLPHEAQEAQESDGLNLHHETHQTHERTDGRSGFVWFVFFVVNCRLGGRFVLPWNLCFQPTSSAFRG